MAMRSRRGLRPPPSYSNGRARVTLPAPRPGRTLGAAGRARAASLGLLLLLAGAVWVQRIERDPHTARVERFEVDTYRYFWPTAAFVHEELARGHLPLWNPYQLAGQPFLAL